MSSVVLVLGFLVSATQAQVAFMREDRALVDKTLRLAPPTSDKRLNQLRSLFVRVGIPVNTLKTQPVPGSDWPNLICTVPGDDDQVVVVGANYTVSKNGVAGWGEAAMLPLAAEAMASAHRYHTYTFVAFAGDGEHSQGAKTFVEHLSKAERKKIVTMVNLQALGMGSPTAWFVERKTPMRKYMEAAADGFRIPMEVSVDRAPVGDSRPFAREDIPALTLQSVADKRQKSLAGDAAATAVVNRQSYYDTYTLLSAFLVILDQSTEVQSASNKSDHSLDRIPGRPSRSRR